MNIPLVNLARQYASIRPDADRAMLAVCAKGDFILGAAVTQFESEFARYTGTKFAIGVASGTDALKLMMQVAGITKGDEVIMQANTFIASALPAIELGATPVFVDCDEAGAIDVEAVSRAITKKTKAILPVHLYGTPAPMIALMKLAKKHKLLLLEDAAQAHGSSIQGKKMGALGDMAAFSFYPGKNLGAFGDGGAIVTNNAHFAEAVQILRNIGQKKKYDHVRLGTNSRLDTLQAAVLSVKLKYLDVWNRKRISIARQYRTRLTGVGDLTLPAAPAEGTIQNYHLFVLQTARRDALMKHLEDAGIHTGIHYPVPLHLTPALSFLRYKKGAFPHAERRAETMLTIPIYAELTVREVEYIVKTIRKFFGNAAQRTKGKTKRNA